MVTVTDLKGLMRQLKITGISKVNSKTLDQYIKKVMDTLVERGGSCSMYEETRVVDIGYKCNVGGETVRIPVHESKEIVQKEITPAPKKGRVKLEK